MIDAQAKMLVLLRHAKSAWNTDAEHDHDRPLSGRGRRAAPVIGVYLAEVGFAPDLVLCSTAVRAQETWQCLNSCVKPTATVLYEPGLYGAGGGAILELIRCSGRRYRCVLVIGHNPGIQDVAALLVGKANPELAARIARKLPTAGLVLMSTNARNWQKLSPEVVETADFVSPKQLV